MAADATPSDTYEEDGDVLIEGHDGEHHPAHLQHHFVSSEQQFEAAKLGMWLFLVTEIMLFGGMFVAYAVFRAWYPELFSEASTQLDTFMGAVNTVVLLLSSLTVAWSIRAAQRDDHKTTFWMLIATVCLAMVFMVIKYFEYTHKFTIGVFPGALMVFPTDEVLALCAVAAQGSAEAAAELYHTMGGHCLTHPRTGLFFAIYYMMTGIHGLHVLIGIVAISYLAIRARKGAYTSVYYTPVENVGLYWHVVDIIWIFLFPLMYLI
ncbi:cytochrome c oxidase subunit 3 family protein [soil metagenome]